MAGSTAGHSLSARMLWLTIGIVLTTEALAFGPGLAWERRRWLAERFAQADVAVLLASAARGGEIDADTRDALLHRTGAREIHLTDSGKQLIGIGTETWTGAEVRIDLNQESWIAGLGRALVALVSDGSGMMRVSNQSPFTVGTELELVLPERGLKEALWRFAAFFSLLSLLIAGVNGAMVYFALVLFLVAPMRRITHSIMAFRSDPERVAPLDPRGVTILPDDEMAFASREIAAMQRALSTVLGRNARLVAVGTSVAKIGHDLRNVLAPALLSSERLEQHSDPSVRRAGEVILSAVDRANELVGQTLKFVRDSPAPLASVRFPLAPLVVEAIETVGASPSCHLRQDVDPALAVNADPDQILRALLNLIRNAVEAGAHSVVVRSVELPASGEEARQTPGIAAIDIADDGRGLPEAVRETLFRPFTRSTKPGGSGLGLAIAHDLIHANNGDMTLVSTGPAGTVFRLTLPTIPAQLQVHPA
jgi:signal transduction histidine kinase